jgi:hypothetical protein
VTEGALAALIDRTIDTSVRSPFGAYLFLDGDPAVEIARDLERRVFLESFGNTPELLAAEYRPYDEASLFLCVVDHRARRAAGMVRLIVPVPGGPGLKSLVDFDAIWGERPAAAFARVGIGQPSPIWDIATLAVAPAYRTASAHGLVSLGLYQAVVRIASGAGVRWLCALLDTAVYRMSRARFAEPFDLLANPRPYLGSSASAPVICDLVAWHTRLERADPAIAEVIYDGVGIEPALAPVPSAVARALVERLVPASAPLSSRLRAVATRGDSGGATAR